MPLQEYIVPIIAAYGAILSTIIFLQKWYETKPKIKVDGFVCDDPDEGKGISVIVRNFGKNSITLSWACVEQVPSSLIDRLLRKMYIKTEDLDSSESIDRIEGIEITRGKNCIIFFSFDYYIPKKWIKNQLTCRGIVIDQLGNKYPTKPIKLSAEKK